MSENKTTPRVLIPLSPVEVSMLELEELSPIQILQRERGEHEDMPIEEDINELALHRMLGAFVTGHDLKRGYDRWLREGKPNILESSYCASITKGLANKVSDLEQEIEDTDEVSTMLSQENDDLKVRVKQLEAGINVGLENYKRKERDFQQQKMIADNHKDNVLKKQETIKELQNTIKLYGIRFGALRIQEGRKVTKMNWLQRLVAMWFRII